MAESILIGLAGVVLGAIAKPLYRWIMRQDDEGVKLAKQQAKCLHAYVRPLGVRQGEPTFLVEITESGPGTYNRWCLQCSKIFTDIDQLASESFYRLRKISDDNNMRIVFRQEIDNDYHRLE